MLAGMSLVVLGGRQEREETGLVSLLSFSFVLHWCLILDSRGVSWPTCLWLGWAQVWHEPLLLEGQTV